MARLLAVMNATIEGAITRVSTTEHASPFLDNILTVLSGMLFVTRDFITAVGA